MRPWPQILSLAALAVFAFALNANTLYCGFLLDDETQVRQNPWIQDWSHIPEMFSGNVWSFSGSRAGSNYYRPVMHIGYLLTNKAFGMQPWGFHLVNVLLHVVNTLMIFVVATFLLERSRDGEPGRKTDAEGVLTVPFIAALLFAAHPVHSEAIAWIASLPELLFTMFFLGSLAVYLSNETLSKMRLGASSLLYGLALLCKEPAIVLPGILIITDICVREKEPPAARLARYAPYIAITLVYLVIRHFALGSSALPALPMQTMGFGRYVRLALPLFAEYVLLVLVPVGLHYWHAIEPIKDIATLQGILGIGVFVLFVVAAVVAWKRHRLSFFSMALFLLPLLPAFHVTAIATKPFAERYLYLPSAGFVLLAALFFRRYAAGASTRIIAIAGLIALLSLYSAGTVSHNRVWKDLSTLYADNLAKSPNAPIPCDDLAHMFLTEGRVDEGIALFEQALRSRPNAAGCESGLGSALLLKGRTGEAIVHLQNALVLDPYSLDTLNDLGVALRSAGRNTEAIAQYRKALELAPDYADAHFSLASALADSGKTSEALEHYRAAVRLRPAYAYYRAVLGIECAKQNLLDEAIEQFQEAVRLDPGEPAYRNDLERAMRMKSGTSH